MSKGGWGGNLVFFFLGAATGAAVAILYAPQEGEATRRAISDKASAYMDKATEITGSMTQTARDKVGHIADKAQEVLTKIQPVIAGRAGASDDSPRDPGGNSA